MTSGFGIAPTVGYWQLIKHNDRFRKLWAAQLISAAGDWFNSVAVLGLALQLSGSGFGASLVLLCSTLPTFFLAPIAGPVVDRFDRRQIMIWTNVVSAVIALLFLFVHESGSLWILYAASILLVVSATFFGPASAASIPNIVSKNELFSANALSGATWGIMVMVGSALGGIVSTLFGRNIAFVVNSLSFLLAAALIVTLKVPSPRTEKAMTPWRDFTEGLRYLRRNPPVLSLVSVKTGWGMAAGSLVLLSVFGQQVFKAGDAGIGLLYAARGTGALIGPFVIRPLVGNSVHRMRQALWLCFLIGGTGYFLLAIAGWSSLIGIGCLALMIAHFGGGIVWALSSVLLQIMSPDQLRGRVFAVDNGFNTLATGLSTLIFGLALQVGAVPMALALVGAGLYFSFGVGWNLVTARGRLRVTQASVEAASGVQTYS